MLARYPEQADAYFKALKMAEVPNLRRVTDYDFAFRPGVEVTEIRPTSKGNRGIVRTFNRIVNQNGETVISYNPLRMMAGREA